MTATKTFKVQIAVFRDSKGSRDRYLIQVTIGGVVISIHESSFQTIIKDRENIFNSWTCVPGVFSVECITSIPFPPEYKHTK